MHRAFGFSVVLFFLTACTSTPHRNAAPVELTAVQEWADACKPWDKWDKPGPPFRIHGNSYYVGTCGIAAILIAGSDGHVMIDVGTESAADLVAANIATLGFDVADIEILLLSHEHFDHAAGIATLQDRTGASFLASGAAAPVLSSGEAPTRDPQFGALDAFPEARVDGILEDGALIELGDIAIRIIETPGHTPGALSYQWNSCDPDGCETIVYANSLSPVSADDYRFSDHLEYIAAYRAGLTRLAQLDCSLLMTPHPSASFLHARIAAGDLTAAPTCDAYAASISKRLDARLAKEQDAR
ncbi:MAG: subclass B3 metallo-beta-lactamase [Pacificimonas sp.]